MIFSSNRVVRVVLAGLLIVVMGKLVWAHRNDDWVLNLLRPQGPAKVDIKFDNGSVRDAVVPNEDIPADPVNAPAVRNVAGELKKCLHGRKVIYTDQVCPAGSKVAPVNGGSVAVLESSKPKVNDATGNRQGARQTLRDALDISGGENLKDKMIEQATKQ